MQFVLERSDWRLAVKIFFLLKDFSYFGCATANFGLLSKGQLPARFWKWWRHHVRSRDFEKAFYLNVEKCCIHQTLATNSPWCTPTFKINLTGFYNVMNFRLREFETVINVRSCYSEKTSQIYVKRCFVL